MNATAGIKTIVSMSLDDAIVRRHSSRRFQPTPIPKEKLQAALGLATYAPSNSNIQPWRLFLLSGSALQRLNSALVKAARSGQEPSVPQLPADFKHFRSELGQQVYGTGLGIPREDTAARRLAVLRNFDFFGAPSAAIVCMHKDLSAPDVLSVGMYLQTFLLALTEQGIDSCVEVSVVGYPKIIREVVGVPEEMNIICGVAIGFEDETCKVNQVRPRKLNVEEVTVILND